MNYTDIIKLLEAGYTREEILEMKDEPAKDPEPAPTEEKQEEKQETSDIMESVMTEVKDMFAEMKKELTAMNILNSRQEGEDSRSTEDILASIINPTKKKE